MSDWLQSSIKKAPTWSALKQIAGGPLIKFTALAPFVGYLLLFNPELSSRFFKIEIFEGCNKTIFTFYGRMYITYIGLTLIGLSVLIFSRCPANIKDYNNRYDFVSSEMNIMDHHRIIAFFNAMFQITKKERYKRAHDFCKDKENTGFNDENSLFTRATIKSLIKYGLEDLYIHQNNSKLKSRMFIFYTYSIGVLLLALPSAEMLIRIIILPIYKSC
jgi:hypothetical protein